MSSKIADTELLTSRDIGKLLFLPFRNTPSNADESFASDHARPAPSTLRRIAGYGAGLGIIFLITLFFRTAMSVNTTTVGFTYLMTILAASTIWGFGVSASMSVTATLAFDYFFLPPVGSLNISDPQDWVGLSCFLFTSVLGSSLSARAHNRAAEADRRRQELERLYALSQRLLSGTNFAELSRAIPRHVLETFAADSAALFLSGSGEFVQAGGVLTKLDLELMRQVALNEEPAVEEQGSVWCAPLRIDAKVIGSVAISSPAVSKETMGALGSLIALSVERATAMEHVAKMEAARESEQFKSVMLDAITHDFRTPLTCIKSSVTALLTDLQFEWEQKADLLAVIDEESDRIDHLLDKASQMARVGSGELKFQLAAHTIGELISVALAECKGISRARPLRCEVEYEELKVYVDLPWAKSVLVQLISNAHLYSWPGRSITIGAGKSERFALFRVADEGPGIEQSEASRIFERFYRCKNQKNRVQGTGMGLPIARAIVEAHGGTIEVVSESGQGSIFTFTLPLVPVSAARVDE